MLINNKMMLSLGTGILTMAEQVSRSSSVRHNRDSSVKDLKSDSRKGKKIKSTSLQKRIVSVTFEYSPKKTIVLLNDVFFIVV